MAVAAGAVAMAATLSATATLAATAGRCGKYLCSRLGDNNYGVDTDKRGYDGDGAINRLWYTSILVNT